MTAERRSTAAARFSMLMPLERSTRLASTLVRRSSQRFTGMPALVAAHVDGVAHEDQADLALADELLEGGEVGALSDAHQVGQPLGGDAQGIADSQSDAFLAQVQGQDAGLYGRQINFIIDGSVLHSRQGRPAPWR